MRTSPLFRTAALAVTLLLTLGACASTPPVAAPAELASSRDKAVRFDRIVVSAQPSQDDLSAWRLEGVNRVFNLRTPAEMADRSRVPFDEAATVRGLGLEYLNQPIDGREFPFTPEALEAFAAVMQAQSGKVLLHCATGNRAGWLYAAYAVKYLGKSPDEAMRSLEPLGHWPLPLQQLTDIPLRVERVEP